MSGKVITEGDQALKANIARELFNVDGAGIKVGIISTSFDAQKKASDDVISGDLPGTDNPDGRVTPVQILKDLRQDSAFATDEGRALAQVIHDIAPRAELLFHTCFGDDGNELVDVNDESYTAAVNALVQAGADIIIDDVQFPTAIFQDGEAAQAVQDAVSEGVVYISAAGNNGKLSYQGDYRSNNEVFSFGDRNFEAYDFDPGSDVDLFQDITVTKDSTLILPTLTWDDPVGEVASNLEMLLLDSPNLPGQGGNVLAISDIPSPSAAEYPIRSLAYPPIKDQKLYLLIGRELNGSPAPNQIKWISLANGLDRSTKYQYVNDSDQAAGSSTVFGAANTVETITVGATDYKQNPDAGVTSPELRSYSSRGGVPILYDEDGDPLLNPDIRSKPEITAPDGVLTTFDAGTEFNPFRGTSASAAHIAGVAALMLERAGGKRSLTPDQVKKALQESSIPLKPQDNLASTAGFVQADSAVTESFICQLTGTSDDDTIRGTEASNNIFGGSGKDTLDGSGGKDYLLGEAGDDLLAGDVGNDVLLGGSGKNVISGGQGKDSFVLDKSSSSVIADFQDGYDMLGVSSSIKFSELKIFQQGSDTIIGFSGNEWARLNGVSANLLTEADFIFV